MDLGLCTTKVLATKYHDLDKYYLNESVNHM